MHITAPLLRKAPVMWRNVFLTTCLVTCCCFGDEASTPTSEQPDEVDKNDGDARSAVRDEVIVDMVHVRFADRARVAFQRPGTILSILVKEGDDVKSGQVVASLDTAVAEAEYQLAKVGAEIDSEVRLAEKQLEATQHESDLVQKGNADAKSIIPPFPEADVVRLKLAAAAAAVEVDVRKDQRRLAGLRGVQALAELEAHKIKAPFDGLVTRVQKSAGESVQQADVILEIVNTQVIVIDGYVDLETSGRICRGCRAEFTPGHGVSNAANDQASFAGELRLVDVTLEEVREVVRISATFPNADGLLREGITGTLRIYPEATAEKVALPVGSVSLNH